MQTLSSINRNGAIDLIVPARVPTKAHFVYMPTLNAVTVDVMPMLDYLTDQVCNQQYSIAPLRLMELSVCMPLQLWVAVRYL